MGTDQFTEVTSEGLFSRLGGAVKGVIVGVLLLVVGIGGLFWNEGRAVRRAKDLEAGAGALVEIGSVSVNAAHEGDLVHFTGEATTKDTLEDDAFDVAINGLRLRREVEMYQWLEREEQTTRNKVGGGRETTSTYSYQKGWSNRLVDSSQFKKSDGHANPASMPFSSQTQTAEHVMVGSFWLPQELVKNMTGFKPIAPPEPSMTDRYVVQGNYLYTAQDTKRKPTTGDPKVGDMRIAWSYVPAGPVSAVGVQRADTLIAWTGPSGSSVYELRSGTHSGQEMFATLEQQNAMFTWLIRGGGFLALLVGLTMIFSPLAVLADILPPVGAVVRTGTGLVSFLLAVVFATCTIGLGWVFYRPLIGIPLLAVCGLGAAALVVAIRRKGGSGAEAPTTADVTTEPRQAA